MRARLLPRATVVLFFVGCIPSEDLASYSSGPGPTDVDVEGLPGQPLQLQYSLNQMDEFDVREGASVRFALRADRLRVFPLGAA